MPIRQLLNNGEYKMTNEAQQEQPVHTIESLQAELAKIREENKTWKDHGKEALNELKKSTSELAKEGATATVKGIGWGIGLALTLF